MLDATTATAVGDPNLARRLARETSGEVLFSPADRGRYATDASIYQVEPIGVFVPRGVDDAAAAIAIAREHGVPVLARGAATSQCSQTVNRALVIDCSKYLRRIDSENVPEPGSRSGCYGGRGAGGREAPEGGAKAHIVSLDA